MLKTVLIRLFLPLGLALASIAQVTPGLYVTTPTEGQLVSGTVDVKGSVPDDGFDYAEVSYAFSDENAPNWFQIARLDEPVHDATLALWDTTTITDGIYRLKVTVHRKDLSTSELIVENLKVGNYTHYEEATATQASVQLLQPEEQTTTPTVVISPQPTSLPQNPASIDPGDFRLSLGSGLVLAVLMLAVLGVYAFFRRIARK